MSFVEIENRTTTYTTTANSQIYSLGMGKSIDVASGYGFNLYSHDNVTTIVEGSITSGNTYGYYNQYVSSGYAANQALLVTGSGEISGAAGVALWGDNGYLSNEGLIQGTTGWGVYTWGRDTQSTVINSERIKSENSDAIYAANHSFDLNNDGSIVGGANGVETNLYATGAGSRIDNDGLIKGADYGIFYSGTDTNDVLLNDGKIKGGNGIAIQGNNSKQIVLNSGKIDGDVNLSGGDDVFIGKGGWVDGKVDGGSGHDKLRGGDLADKLKGNTGNDKLGGQKGKDKLFGNEGEDQLNGGRGNDILSGGADADVFVFRNKSGRDKITDFDENGGDQIDLSHFGITSFKKLEKNAVEYKHGNAYIDLDEVGGDGLVVVKNIVDFDAGDFIF